MSDSYTYLFADWHPDSRMVLTELPMNGVTFDLKLNEAGNFQGFIPLFEQGGDRPIPNSVIKDATQPGKRQILVMRGNNLVWAGWIWSRVYQASSQSLQINGQTMESYAYKRIIIEDLVRNNYGTSDYVALCWKEIEGAAGNNWTRVGVDIDDNYPDTNKKDFNYRGWQMMSVGDLIDDTINSRYGPDYRIDFYWDGFGALKYHLRVGPSLGRPVEDTGLTFEYPGSIKEYWYRENASAAATNLIVATGGYGSNANINPIYPENLDFDPEYPQLEVKLAQRKLNNAGDIRNWGIQQLRQRKPPIAVFTAQTATGTIPELGDYRPGDWCWFFIKDPRFPEGHKFRKRILGWSVTPKRSDSAEDITITFNGGEDDFSG